MSRAVSDVCVMFHGRSTIRAASPRLPLASTLHRDRFDEAGLREAVEGYDARRASAQPYSKQRDEAEFGSGTPYTWSEDKTRQYSKPMRADFGAFIRAKGFCLE